MTEIPRKANVKEANSTTAHKRRTEWLFLHSVSSEKFTSKYLPSCSQEHEKGGVKKRKKERRKRRKRSQEEEARKKKKPGRRS